MKEFVATCPVDTSPFVPAVLSVSRLIKGTTTSSFLLPAGGTDSECRALSSELMPLILAMVTPSYQVEEKFSKKVIWFVWFVWLVWFLVERN
jgi:hypothetical protein